MFEWLLNTRCTKNMFSIKDFFSKCDQIRSFLRIWSNLLKRSLMENFIFCAVTPLSNTAFRLQTVNMYLPMSPCDRKILLVPTTFDFVGLTPIIAMPPFYFLRPKRDCSKAYSVPYQIPKKELFAKIVDSFQMLTIFTKSSTLDA